MSRSRRRLLGLAAAAVVVAGLAAGVGFLRPAGAVRPAPVMLGVDTCEECGMVIRDPRSAAQLVLDDRVLKFDDVGCLIVYQNRHHPDWQDVQAAYVADWRSGQWVEARQAWWVPTGHKTPMLYGLVTLQDRRQAEEMAAEHGSRVLTYEEASRLELFAGHSHSAHKGSAQEGHHP